MNRKIEILVVIVATIIFSFAADALADKEIKIGVIGPMKFNMGEHAWYGATLAAEEINASGGVKINNEAYKIKLIKADSNELLSIVDAVSAMEKLITVDKVNFLAGGARSEAAMAQQEVMAEHKVIWMAPPVSPQLSLRLAGDYDKYKYWFRTLLNSRYYVNAGFSLANIVANEIRDELGIEKPKVALLMSKLLFIDPMVKIAKDVFPKMGLEIVGVWRPSHKASDVTAELSAIKAAGAQIIFQVTSSSVGTTISRQWGELQIPAALVGLNLQAKRKGHWEATGGKCEYNITTSYYAPAAITERSIPFWNNMLTRFDDYPQATTSVYDGIHILRAAIEKANTLDSDILVTTLENMEFEGAIGRMNYMGKDSKTPHEMRWGPNYIPKFGLQWIDGGLVTIWPDGKPLPSFISEDPKWEGVRYEGTSDVVLPPWMVKYWKNKK